MPDSGRYSNARSRVMSNPRRLHSWWGRSGLGWVVQGGEMTHPRHQLVHLLLQHEHLLARPRHRVVSIRSDGLLCAHTSGAWSAGMGRDTWGRVAQVSQNTADPVLPLLLVIHKAAAVKCCVLDFPQGSVESLPPNDVQFPGPVSLDCVVEPAPTSLPRCWRFCIVKVSREGSLGWL